MKRKKTQTMLVLSAAAFAASVYSLAAAAAYQPNSDIEATPTAVSSSQPQSSDKTSSEKFNPKIITIYDGHVAIFEDGNEIPIKILETNQDELPAETVNRLLIGITANTREEYLSYLEDFS